MKKPEYIAHRISHTQRESILSRARFPQARYVLDVVVHELNPQQSVVDIGCGSGENDVYLACKVKGDIVGIDIDRQSIRLAQSVAHYLNLHRLYFVLASGTQLPLRERSMDLALSQEVIEHLEEDPIIILSEIKRILKRGGQLLVSTPVKSFAPFSWDWFEFRVRGRLTLDNYSAHIHRFEPYLVFGYILSASLRITRMRFANQYAAPFICFAISLWNRRQVRSRNRKLREKDSKSPNFWRSLKDAAIMSIYLIEYTAFSESSFGSDVIVIARR